MLDENNRMNLCYNSRVIGSARKFASMEAVTNPEKKASLDPVAVEMC